MSRTFRKYPVGGHRPHRKPKSFRQLRDKQDVKELSLLYSFGHRNRLLNRRIANANDDLNISAYYQIDYNQSKYLNAPNRS